MPTACNLLALTHLLTLVTHLLTLLTHLRPAAGLDPSGNSRVAACRALAAAAGPSALDTCHVTLAPNLFGYHCNVEVLIEVRTVYGLNNDLELLEWSGWVTLKWVDPRVSWNETETGVRQLKLHRKQLWIPDLGFWNVKEDETMDLRNNKFTDVTVFANGTVTLYLHTVIRLPCEINMRLFPFDTQVCTLEFGSTSSDNSNFGFSLSSRLDSIFYAVGEWQLERLSMHNSSFYNFGQVFNYYNLNFHLRRKPLYYAVLILVPFEMLSAMASLMFFADNQGDRASISIAIVMSMSLYVLIASQSAPKSMNRIPPLGYFLMAQMLILIVCTFVTVVVQGHVSDERQWQLSMTAFVCYLALSVLNAVGFLLIWPLVIG